MRFVRFRGYGGQIQGPSIPKRIDLRLAGRQNRTFVIQNFNYTSVRRKADDEDEEEDGHYEYEKDEDYEYNKVDESNDVGPSEVLKSNLPVQKLRMKQVTFNTQGPPTTSPTFLVDVDNESGSRFKSRNKNEKEIHRQMSLLRANNNLGFVELKQNVGKQGVIHPVKSKQDMKFHVQTFNSKRISKKRIGAKTPAVNSKYSFRVNLNRR